MAGLSAAYSRLLQTSPLSAKFVTSLVLAALSNVVAQLPSGKIDVPCALKYGLLDAPPHSHFWYLLLEAYVPSPLVRTIIDTLIYGPLTSLYFYIGSTLLIDGGTFADAKQKMAGGRFLRTMVNGWKFWPLVSYGNQRWVPFHFRTLTMDIAGFLWNVYMSIATKVADKEAADDADDAMPADCPHCLARRLKAKDAASAMVQYYGKESPDASPKNQRMKALGLVRATDCAPLFGEFLTWESFVLIFRSDVDAAGDAPGGGGAGFG